MIDKPKALEKVTGNLLTKSSLAVLTTITGTPLTALLPILADTLASNRHSERIEDALEKIDLILRMHAQRLNELTDPQYKLLNEVILTVLQTTEEDKIEYLRNVIIFGLDADGLSHTEATQISRVLRDLTVGEIDYMVKNQSKTIMIGPLNEESTPADMIVVERESKEMVYVSGLMALGLLISAGSSLDYMGGYTFTPFCDRLVNAICKTV